MQGRPAAAGAGDGGPVFDGAGAAGPAGPPLAAPELHRLFAQEAHYVSREAPTNTSILLLTWDGDLGYRATAPTAGVIRLIQQTGHGPTIGDAGKQRRPVRTWAARRRPFCLESRFRIRETVLHSNLQTSQFRSPRIPTECSTSTKHITSVLCQISLKSFHL